MYCIGLTGGIASGKSTVVTMLRSLGAAIVDCDVIARQVVAPGSKALEQVASVFGRESILPDGSMNRAYIGGIVFHEPARKKELEDILFPLIYARIDAEKEALTAANPKAVIILDMPLLFEIKYESYVDEVWLVYVDPDTQLQRLMARNQYNRADALARIQAQLPIDTKKSLAQVVIDNRGDLEATQDAVQRAWQTLMARLQG